MLDSHGWLMLYDFSKKPSQLFKKTVTKSLDKQMFSRI